MPRTVADQLAEALAAAGVQGIDGIVRDSLNGHVRHAEEAVSQELAR
jgi:hypothetical protein